MLLYKISMVYIVAIFISSFGAGNKNDRPYVILVVPYNFILSNSHLYYRNAQCFFMAMPVNIILVMYVRLRILSYEFNKLTMLYIQMYISLSYFYDK